MFHDLMLQVHIYTSLLSGLPLKQHDSAMSDYHWVNKNKMKPKETRVECWKCFGIALQQLAIQALENPPFID